MVRLDCYIRQRPSTNGSESRGTLFVMRSTILILLSAALIACSGEKQPPGYQKLSKEPISVRGWIADVEANSANTRFRTAETEAARRAELFQAANVWVDNAPYVSGAIAENGAFVLLDLPPGNVTITFSAPGAPSALIPLEGIPGNADLMVGGLLLTSRGAVLTDPKLLQVRIAGPVSKPTPTNQIVKVAGISVRVVQVPINSLQNRHDYPTPPPEKGAPLAIVR
jgi:hypothetical protein